MRIVFSFLFFLIIHSVSIAAVNSDTLITSSTPLAKTEVVTAPAIKIKDMTCDQLIKAAKDQSNVLNTLAGLRAQKKNCADFKFDWGKTPESEKRLFQIELAELGSSPTVDQEILDKIDVESLKVSIEKENKIAEKIALMKQLRAKYKQLGQKNESVHTLNEIYDYTYKNWKSNKKNSDFQQQHLEAGISLAKQMWNGQNSEKSEEVLIALSRRLKGQQNLIEIYFLQARIHEEKNSLDSARKYYDLVLEEFKNNPPKNLSFNKDKVLWLKSWLSYTNKNWADALKALKALGQETVDVAEKSRAHFFAARCLQKLKRKKEATELFTQVTHEDFYSYYSLLAYKELGLKVPAFNTLKLTTTSNFKVDNSLSFLSERHRKIFNLLILNDEPELAERTPQFLTNKIEQAVQMSIILAEKMNRFLPLFTYFPKLPNDDKLNLLILRNQLIYPKLYQSEVKEMAEKTGLPAALIYSIIKQESAFNIAIRSPANAYGLMQVLPSLAKQLAKKFKLDFKNPEDLFNPGLNIKLGSYELSEQVKKQNNQYAYVAAAYNAGAAALARWLKTKWKPQFDVIDFIEEIPYDETRLYVKVVARNFLFYQRLENPDKELDFPENFIK